jgi:dihydrofolate reductase
VSRSGDTDLGYPNSELLAGDAADQVVALRERSDLPLMVMGSGQLVRVLHAAGLIDEYVLLIHPIVLGSGLACSVWPIGSIWTSSVRFRPPRAS